MLMVVAVAVVLLFTSLYFTARMVMLNGYTKLENGKSLIQVASAVSLMTEQSQQLDGIVGEYAHWDDTYQY